MKTFMKDLFAQALVTIMLLTMVACFLATQP